MGPYAEIIPLLELLSYVPPWMLPPYALCPSSVISIVPLVIAADWGSIEEEVPCASNVNDTLSPMGYVPLADIGVRKIRLV
jgi:hypothetical protein